MDINGDEIPELFIINAYDGFGETSVYDMRKIFTIVDGKSQLCDGFRGVWRYTDPPAFIDKNGAAYTGNHSTWDDIYELYTFKLPPGSSTFIRQNRYVAFPSTDDSYNCYVYRDGADDSTFPDAISSNEFFTIWEEYENDEQLPLVCRKLNGTEYAPDLPPEYLPIINGE